MTDLGLTVKLQVQGAEEVKQKIADIHDQFNRGEITTEEYSKSLRGAGNELKSLGNSAGRTKAQFMAMHPGIASLSRNMHAMSGIFRTGMAVTNALNLAQIAMQGTSSGASAAQQEYNEKLREYNIAVKKYGENSDEAKDAAIALKEADEKLKEQLAKDQKQAIQNMITLGSAIGMLATSMISAVAEFPAFMKSFKDMKKMLAANKSAAMMAGGAMLAGVGGYMLADGGIDALTGKSKSMEDRLKAIGGVAAVGVGLTIVLAQFNAELAVVGALVTIVTIGIAVIAVFRDEISGLFKYLSEELPKMGNAIWKFFAEDIPKSVDETNKKWDKFFLEDIPKWFTDDLPKALNAAYKEIKKFFEELIPKILKAFAEWLGIDGEFGKKFAEAWEGLLTYVGDIAKKIVDKVIAMKDDIIKYVADSLLELAKIPQKLVTGAANAVGGAIDYATGQKQGSTINTATKTLSDFLNLPVKKSAKGFDGMVTTPTMFLAGEAGPERVTVSPNGLSSGVNVQIVVQGSIWERNKLMKEVDGYLNETLSRRGF